MTIITIEDVYRRRNKDINLCSQYSSDAEVISFTDNVENAVPQVLEKMVTRLVGYLRAQKKEGRFDDALWKSKNEIEQILKLVYAYDSPEFNKKIAPQIRRAIMGLESIYDKHSPNW